MTNHRDASSPSGEDWQPSASLETLRQRAQFIQSIRDFFHQHDVLEVETPMLSAAANTSPHVDSFSTCYRGPGEGHGRRYYLHTSPEFPMKRLLAAGSGAIYQLCKVFRNGELGAKHNPEFTMLEWYRPDWHYQQLMDEVAELVQTLCEVSSTERISYGELFQRHFKLDVHQASVNELMEVARKSGLQLGEWQQEGVDFWRDLLMSHVIEPELGAELPLFVYDYPASQAALAQVRSGTPAVAERFELYWRGVELANGYQELLDASMLEERMREELQRRRQLGLEQLPADRHLLAAQQSGLPNCAGVALGADRLFMLKQGFRDIRQVLSFSFPNA